MTKGELAYKLFKEGNNCSQAVALAFEDELELSAEQIKRLIIGFGGGFGRQRLVCGAVSGMTMVLGYAKGKSNDKSEVYAVIQKACAEVKEKIGSLICAELLDPSDAKRTSPEADERTEEYYKKRPCAEICKIVADIVQKYLEI